MGVYVDNGKTITGCNMKIYLKYKENEETKKKEIANISALSTSTEQDQKIMNFIGGKGIGAVGRGIKISQGSMVYEVMNKSFVDDLLGEDNKIHSILDYSKDIDIIILHTEEETGIISKKEITGISFFSENTAVGVDSLIVQEAIMFNAKNITEFEVTNQNG